MLRLYRPNIDDLWFRKAMLEDEETMSYNHAWGGTVSFPKDRWADWYDYWLVDIDNKRYYRYVVSESNEYVGEIAYHFDEELNGYIANVIIYAKYRNRGYGSEALELLCREAKHNGVEVLYDDIAIDNPAIKMFLAHGFKEESRDRDKIYLKKRL